MNTNIDTTNKQIEYNHLDDYTDDENFEYIKGFDSTDYDLEFVGRIPIIELKNKALNNINCIGFNTLGFLKYKFNGLERSPYFNNTTDGFYLKKNYTNVNDIILNNKKYLYLLKFIKNKYNYSTAWKGHFEFAIWLVNLIKPKIIVELGVDYAQSTFSLACELEKNSLLYAIDCFEGDEHAGKRNTLSIVKDTYESLLTQKILLYDNIKFIKGFFDEVNKTFDEKIDLLHIDGLHTYEAVKNDFNSWFPKTSENAVILFHDTVSFPNDVGRFFNELPYFKVNILHSAGLGIVSKNKNIIDTINNKWIKDLNYNMISNNNNYLEEYLTNKIQIIL